MLKVLVGDPKVTWLFVPIALLNRVGTLIVGMQQLLTLHTCQQRHKALNGIMAECQLQDQDVWPGHLGVDWW